MFRLSAGLQFKCIFHKQSGSEKNSLIHNTEPMQFGHGHAAWMWSHSIHWYMPHGHGYAAWTWTGIRTMYLSLACPCPYCMSISMLHVRVHAALTFSLQSKMKCINQIFFYRNRPLRNWLCKIKIEKSEVRFFLNKFRKKRMYLFLKYQGFAISTQ